MANRVYLHGNTVLEIQQALNRIVDLIGNDISPEPIEPITKAVIVQLEPNSSFPANPLLITAIFDPPFVDNQYAVVSQIVGGNGNYKPLRVITKQANQCIIRLEGDGATDLPDSIDVIAREAIIEEFGGYSSSPQPPITPDSVLLSARYLWASGFSDSSVNGMYEFTALDNTYNPPTHIYSLISNPLIKLQVRYVSSVNLWQWTIGLSGSASFYKNGESGPYGIYQIGGSGSFDGNISDVKYELTGFPANNGEYLPIGRVPGGSVYYLCTATGLYLNDWLPLSNSLSRPFTVDPSAPFPIPVPVYSCGGTDPSTGQWHTGMFGPIPGSATPTAP